MSQRIAATDSTTVVGAGVEAVVPQEVAEALYRLGELRGEYVRLDWSASPDALMRRPQQEVHDILRAVIRCRVTRMFRFRQKSHVNSQETRAIRAD